MKVVFAFAFFFCLGQTALVDGICICRQTGRMQCSGIYGPSQIYAARSCKPLDVKSIELSRPNLRLDALPMSVFKRYESLVDVVVWDSSLCSLLPAGLFDDYSVRGCAVPPPDASTALFVVEPDMRPCSTGTSADSEKVRKLNGRLADSQEDAQFYQNTATGLGSVLGLGGTAGTVGAFVAGFRRGHRRAKRLSARLAGPFEEEAEDEDDDESEDARAGPSDGDDGALQEVLVVSPTATTSSIGTNTPRRHGYNTRQAVRASQPATPSKKGAMLAEKIENLMAAGL